VDCSDGSIFLNRRVEKVLKEDNFFFTTTISEIFTTDEKVVKIWFVPPEF
jgi:hypothetical protein